jgi:uncharacterized membrane protein YfcA
LRFALLPGLPDLPDLPIGTLVQAALVVTASYVVYGLSGFGAAIFGVPLLVHLFPLRFVVPMMLVFDLCAGLLLGLHNRQRVDWRELRRLAPFVVVGMVLGVTALVQLPERWLLLLLGSFVSSYAAWSLFSRTVPSEISTRWAVPAGAVGGVFTALYGTGGPIYTLYLARRLSDKTALRASIGVMIFFTAWARLALFASAGLLFQPGLLALAVCLLPCVALGYAMGSRLHRALPPWQTTRVLWMLLMAGGVNLVWRALHALA